ncbi:bifunctional adenosylcobinamide kinase/adenosylcobinamide-phosphate guanylyltransferase, partial [Polymorphospora sp. 2-325]
MSVDGLHTVLVLGGIRSGKSEFAESLVADAPVVRYVATAPELRDDPEWTARIRAHHERRPRSWTTEEVAGNPSELARVLGSAPAGETLLVDDLGGWVTVLLDPVHQPADDRATIDELAVAVRDCAARLVLVSPEVGLSLVPANPIGRAFADALGSTNQAVAAVSDAVALVVAGQPTWLKTPATATPATASAATTPAAPAATPTAPATTATTPTTPAGTGAANGLALDKVPAGGAARPAAVSPEVLTPPPPPDDSAPPLPADAWTAPTMTLPVASTGLVIQPGMELPMPDEYAGPQALDRLAELDLPGTGLGNLEHVVKFAAATQGVAVPRPWRSVRVLLLHGDHAGGSAAGVRPDESRRR